MIGIMPYIDENWKKFLQEEFNSPYFEEIKAFLDFEISEHHIVYPAKDEIFSAFNNTPKSQLKVVILGQDPYHGPGQAHGLAFSVPHGIKIPPSLRNIFKEMRNDLGKEPPASGNLEMWSEQGVLLLNSTLSVRANEAASHQKHGWEKFTDAVIRKISVEHENIVFILWGKFAQAKEILIDQEKHYILKAAHPSPFAANRGFFGCKHFSKTNKYLQSKRIPEISWS